MAHVRGKINGGKRKRGVSNGIAFDGSTECPEISTWEAFLPQADNLCPSVFPSPTFVNAKNGPCVACRGGLLIMSAAENNASLNSNIIKTKTKPSRESL
jgi:hypothetical protein